MWKFPQTFFTFKLKLSCIHDEENVLHVKFHYINYLLEGFLGFPPEVSREPRTEKSNRRQREMNSLKVFKLKSIKQISMLAPMRTTRELTVLITRLLLRMPNTFVASIRLDFP